MQMFRYSLLTRNLAPVEPFDGTVMQPAVFWGPSFHIKLLIVAAPIGIMITTILLILISFYNLKSARDLLGVQNIMSFNPTATPHIVAACTGKITTNDERTIPIPPYDELDKFSRSLIVQWVGKGKRNFGLQYNQSHER